MESHFMMFRLGSVDALDKGVVSAETAQGALNRYLSDGWAIVSVLSGGSNDDGTQVTILLTRKVAVTAAK